jgi:molybdopterin synthase catalytic subunit
MSISIQKEDFDLTAEMQSLRTAGANAGALVSFVGLVRDMSDAGKVENIFLEHYPGMSEKALQNILVEANSRWKLLGVRVIHRVGELRPNDQIVMVATASAHRADAFAACEFIMDYLKTSAPFWKREQTAGGTTWLDTKASDVARAERWIQQGDME